MDGAAETGRLSKVPGTPRSVPQPRPTEPVLHEA